MCADELQEKGADAFPPPELSESPPTTPQARERDQAAADSAHAALDSTKCAAAADTRAVLDPSAQCVMRIAHDQRGPSGHRLLAAS